GRHGRGFWSDRRWDRRGCLVLFFGNGRHDLRELVISLRGGLLGRWLGIWLSGWFRLFLGLLVVLLRVGGAGCCSGRRSTGCSSTAGAGCTGLAGHHGGAVGFFVQPVINPVGELI